MMKRFRKAAAQETSAPAPETTETATAIAEASPFLVTVGETEWDLQKVTTLTVEGNKSEALTAALNHVEKNDDTLRFFAFDLLDTLSDVEGNVRALNEHEAWDLSVALVEEISDRKEGKGGQRFVVAVLDHAALMNNENPEDAELYVQFLGNMETVAVEGASYGINLLLV